ncbi:MAG: hypothetical protein MORG_03207 [Morganella sp. (in: enterobacteria)]
MQLTLLFWLAVFFPGEYNAVFVSPVMMSTAFF